MFNELELYSDYDYCDVCSYVIGLNEYHSQFATKHGILLSFASEKAGHVSSVQRVNR